MVLEEYADDTIEPPAGEISREVPAAFVKLPRPHKIPSHTELRYIMWLVNVSADGSPAWIRGEVAGGPCDPLSRAHGVTMRLKCTWRLDAKTPKEYFKEQLEAAFSLDNYGTMWVMLGPTHEPLTLPTRT